MNIRIENATRSFGNFRALAGVTLNIQDGELVALLGPSGSGKTTLLRMIAGLEQQDPDSPGSVQFDGLSTEQLSLGERKVGFVFQHYALFRHMTVYENIAFGLRIKPRSERPTKQQIDERVKKLLKLIQLEGISKRYPAQLSGGQRQRVALARALAIEPRVLLLDEPFGALDARVRQDLRRWLRELHNTTKVTTVIVTHDQEEALEVADKIVVMNQGQIEQIGTPDEVFHKPQNEFVARFMGHVNLFHSRLEGEITSSLGEASGSQQNKSATPLLVRADDWEIYYKQRGGEEFSAKIYRIHSAGIMVRVEFLRENGQSLIAQLTHENMQMLKLAEGQMVFLRARRTVPLFDQGGGI